MMVHFDWRRYKKALPSKELEMELVSWVACRYKLDLDHNDFVESGDRISLMQIVGIPMKIALILTGHLLWLVILLFLPLSCLSFGKGK